MKELFQKKLKDKGFDVIHLFPILHEGWEMDNWGAVVEKDGAVKLVTTNHGSLEILEGNKAVEEVKNLTIKYRKALRSAEVALEHITNA